MFPIRDTKGSGKIPLITIGLILANIFVFFLELTTPNLNLFISKYALIPTNVNFANSQTLTPFITSMFLHAGFIHILSNMWFLWVFGDNIEAKIGHIKYFAFYIFCGVTANFFQYLFSLGTTIPMLGASGAIAGILGAYLKRFPRNRIDTVIPIFGLPLILPLSAYIILIYWFFTQAFNGVATIVENSAATGQIAYIAHVGGFTTGFLTNGLFIW